MSRTALGVVWPREKGYLRPAAEDETVCLAKADGFECTRKVGHPGKHAAHGRHGQQFATWTAEGSKGGSGE